LKSLAGDGERLYYLAYTDMAYGLDANTGREIWRYPTENWSPGFVLSGERLYFGSDNAFVHAVEGRDGEAVWRTALEGVFNSPRGRPVVDGQSLYFQSNDNRLYALDKETGVISWQTDPQPRSRVAVTVGDGYLFLSGQDGVLSAYETD
jgi:outer membrane protein assembly factor BamB